MMDKTTWSRATALLAAVAPLGGCDEGSTTAPAEAPERLPTEEAVEVPEAVVLDHELIAAFQYNLPSMVLRLASEYRMAPRFAELRTPGRQLATASVLCGVMALAPACADEARIAGPPAVIDLPPADLTLQERDFSRVLSVVELEDGRALVTDQIENSIYVVDLQSGEVRTEGSTGEGPGEYGRVGHLYPLGGDSTLFVGEPPRPLLLAGDRIVEDLEPVYPRLGMGGTGEPPWGVDRSGRVLGVEGFAYQPRSGWSRTHADSLHILLSTGSIFDGRTSEPDTIARVGGQGRWGIERVSTVAQMGGREVTMNSTLTSPLASEGQAWLFADGWIALAHPDPYRVDWLTPAGEWVRGAPLSVAPTDVTLEEQCLAISRRVPDAECDPDRYPDWPSRVPPFTMVLDRGWVTPGGTALRPGPHGLLLIRRTPTAEAPEIRYDVVDRSGTLRGAIRMPEGSTVVGFGRASIYAVQKDEMDLLTLSRHPWLAQFGSD